MEDVKHGDIIEISKKKGRTVWVLLHRKYCSDEMKLNFSRKNSKNYLPFVMVSGLWHDNRNRHTDQAYGKFNGQLTRGCFNSMEVVGHIDSITNKQLASLK